MEGSIDKCLIAETGDDLRQGKQQGYEGSRQHPFWRSRVYGLPRWLSKCLHQYTVFTILLCDGWQKALYTAPLSFISAPDGNKGPCMRTECS